MVLTVPQKIRLDLNTSSEEEGDHRRWWRRDYSRQIAMVLQNLPFSFDMYPHFFDGAKKRRYPSKKRFPTPAVCSRKRCPLHKGTKTLHRKNGGSDSRPPSFRPTAVFILHLPPGYFWLDLDGWDYNPFVISFRNATSLCTREAALRVAWESLFRKPSADTFPSGKADSLDGSRRNTSSVCFADTFPSRGRLNGWIWMDGITIPPSFLSEMPPPFAQGRLFY